MVVTTENFVRKDSFLSSQLRLLQLVLMWPIHCDRYYKHLVQLYFCFVVASLSMCTVGLLSKAIVTTDLVDRSEAIDIVTLTSSGLFKMLYFSLHRKEMKALVDFVDCEFHTEPEVDNSSLNMKHWMRFCGPFSIIHCLLAFGAISFWGICPILNVLFGIKPLSEMTLPMNVWYPYDFNTGNVFKLLYVVHFFSLISSTHVYMSCDGFFFSLIYLVNGQIIIIKANLREIENIVPKGQETVEEARYNGLKRCIEHHNKVLSFLRALDGEFRSMIVADVLHAIISLSFAMLQTSESIGILESIKMVFFLSYCFIHQYLNSLFGQSLINQQESLMSSVYSVDWIDESQPFKKSLQIMMTGSVYPVKFSAWRMYFLQYETFLEFVKTMVSVFMVLRTLREQGMIAS